MNMASRHLLLWILAQLVLGTSVANASSPNHAPVAPPLQICAEPNVENAASPEVRFREMNFLRFRLEQQISVPEDKWEEAFEGLAVHADLNSLVIELSKKDPSDLSDWGTILEQEILTEKSKAQIELEALSKFIQERELAWSTEQNLTIKNMIRGIIEDKKRKLGQLNAQVESQDLEIEERLKSLWTVVERLRLNQEVPSEELSEILKLRAKIETRAKSEVQVYTILDELLKSRHVDKTNGQEIQNHMRVLEPFVQFKEESFLSLLGEGDVSSCGLSFAERVALYWYSADGSNYTNPFLDKNRRQIYKNIKEEKLKGFVDTLTSALERLAPFQGEVRRYIEFDETVTFKKGDENCPMYFKDDSKCHFRGSEAFMSTTRSWPFGGGVEMVIQVHSKCRWIGPFTQLPQEDEVLCLPGIKLNGPPAVFKQDGTKLMHLTESEI